MPKLWDATIDEHRRTVQAAILDTTALLVAEGGLAAVTMSQIAAQVGIGRATLYKYFPDVDAIVTAWHERQVTDHLHRLSDVADTIEEPGERLEAVMHTYAELAGQQHGGAHPPQVTGPLHRAGHVEHARQQLHQLVTDAIAAAAKAGAVRQDVPAAELATYCLYALGAAAATPALEARQRLVAVTLTGLTKPST